MHILNEYQLAAVTDEHDACVVNANVGSGKTTVLIEKIAWLKSEKQVDLKDMVVLTFTNKAANEIKERLQKRFPELHLIRKETQMAEEDLYFGTFHSVAMKLLQSKLPIEEYGLLKDFQVMLPEEELEIARQLIVMQKLNIKYKNRLKKRLDTFQQKPQGEAGRKNPYDDDFELLIEHLKQEKQRQNKVTYRDLIHFAGELLQKYPDLFKPGWVIIDEVQDCDVDQLAFIHALKQEQTHLFAVGDPNQVIYGWRGSAFQIFSLLKKRYNAVELSLPVNYRSSRIILQAASRFKQSGEALISSQDTTQNKIKVTSHYDPFAEADYLAGEIKRAHEAGLPYEEIGILYRLQSQSEVLTKVFDRHEIPYEVSKKQQFFEEPIINWLYHLFRYLVNDADQTSLLRVVTDKAYGDSLTEKKALKLLTQEEVEKIPLLCQIRELFPLPQIRLKTQMSLWSLQETRMIPQERQNLQESESPEDLIRSWIEKLRTSIHLKERIGLTSADYQKDLTAADAFSQEFINSKKDIASFVNEAALYGISFAREEAALQTGKVRLMTLHASKGLEFEQVYLIGMNPGLIPLSDRKEEQMEEEQRLLFVGMTRAKKKLELSYYQSSPQPLVASGPSPYLRMLKPEWIDAPSLEKKDAKEAAKHLQDIKREVMKNRISHTSQDISLNRSDRSEKESDNASAQNTVEQESESVSAQNAVEQEADNASAQNAVKQEADNTSAQEPEKKRILHARYGKGTVLKEDGDMITIDFDDFGEKEMLKAFSNFTILEG